MRKPEKYINLGLDFLNDKLEKDNDLLIMYCALMPPEMKIAFRIPENYDFSQLRKSNRLWTLFMQVPVMLGVADGLRNAGSNTIPIIESLFYNFEAKIGFYNACKDYLKILQETSPSDLPEINLDEIPKTLIYFDLGLETSLKRQRNDTKPHISEQKLKMFYPFQEIPINNELPNLEVYVIKSEDDLNRALKQFE